MTADDYLPFDVGSWRGELNCPRHGMQHGGLAVQIKPRRDRDAVITRRYCGMCVLALLDAVGGDGGAA